MKSLRLMLFAAAAALVLSSCISRSLPEVSYYLLEYLPGTEKDSLRLTRPILPAVYIDDTELPRAFVRRQIVNRLEGPEYRYLRDHMWGSDLSETIPYLLESRMRAYGISSDPGRELRRQRQKYQVRSRLERIEYVHWGTRSEALVEVEFSLVDREAGTTLVRHTARRSSPVKIQSVAGFVAVANRMLLTEIDAFLAMVEKTVAKAP